MSESERQSQPQEAHQERKLRFFYSLTEMKPLDAEAAAGPALVQYSFLVLDQDGGVVAQGRMHWPWPLREKRP